MIFIFLLCLLFILSNQPFQMTLLIIFLMLNLLYYIYCMSFFCWVNYILILIYLGGLLILFIYLTSIISNFLKTNKIYSVILFFLFLFSMKMIYKDQTFNFNNYEMGIFIFSFKFSMMNILFIFFVILLLLLIISSLSKLIAPLRQQ